MVAYRLHFVDHDARNVVPLYCLDDLAARVAVEQLAHELNPVIATGYIVCFSVEGPRGWVAAGHFYVRTVLNAARAVNS